MADLTTLSRLKYALGIAPGDTEEDTKLSNALAAASASIRAHTDRKFEINSGGTSSTRTFEYDGTGYVEIDEAQTVTNVVVVRSNVTDLTLDTEEWEARPYNGPIYDYITVPTYLGRISREMGFKRNLDRYEGPLHGYDPSRVNVTAVWGWTQIPEDVQQAAVWTAIALAENPKPYTSEAIEGFSRSVRFAPIEAIPERAMSMLVPYLRVNV